MLINRTGVYKTRNGTLVKVTDLNTGSQFTFPIHGYRQRQYRGKLRFNKWGTWQRDGRFQGIAGHGLDIVSYLGADYED